jgi:hypothetical protein
MKALLASIGLVVLLFIVALLAGFLNFWPGIPHSLTGWFVVAILGFGYMAAEVAGEALFSRGIGGLGFLAYRYLPVQV